MIDLARGIPYKNSGRKSLHLLRPPNLNHDVTMTEADKNKPFSRSSRKPLLARDEKSRLEYKRQWRIKNRDRILARRRNQYNAEGSVARASADTYRQENRQKISEYQKEWNIRNRERLAEKRRAKYINNRDSILIQQKEYREKNKQAISEKRKAFNKKNKEKVIARQKVYRERHKHKRVLKYRDDVQYRLASLVRNRLKDALRAQKCRKNNKTISLLGCDILSLRRHLELNFSKGMTWENQGSVWHIDHIIPLSSFDLTDEAQLKIACHWTNLRPLNARKNLTKSAKITEPQMHLLLPAA
jgi:hypothetical protein